MSPARILVVAFAAAVVVGTALLMLPQAAAPGVKVSWVDALFTATSAVCVTGLTVVPTASAWSPFGHGVILVLIQIGGLGIMTVSTLMSVLLGRRITLQDRLVMRLAFQESDLAGLVRLLRHTAAAVLAIEAVGAVLLALRFLSDMPWPRALWFGLFHAVSAFNNAGFDLFGASLAPFIGDGYVLGVVAGLVIAGGLGFQVLLELHRRAVGRQSGPASLHARVVLVVTAVLLVGGGVVTLLLEWDNPATLGSLTPAAKLANGFFLSIAARTAGFSTVDAAALTTPALLVLVALMFIGGAPGSTAGGVKVTTVAAVVASVGATLTGRQEPVLFRRRLGREQLDRALALFIVALLVLATGTLLMLLLEDVSTTQALFQVTSALGTVGLSTLNPADLGVPGRLLLVTAMFVGRVGPLTLVYALAQRRRRQMVRYPEDWLPVG